MAMFFPGNMVLASCRKALPRLSSSAASFFESHSMISKWARGFGRGFADATRRFERLTGFRRDGIYRYDLAKLEISLRAGHRNLKRGFVRGLSLVSHPAQGIETQRPRP